MDYFLRGVLLAFEMLGVVVAFLGLSSIFHGQSLKDVVHGIAEGRSSIALATLWLIEIAYQILALRLVVMRLHDIGVRGWWGAVGVLVLIALREIVPSGATAGWLIDAIALSFGLLVLFWRGTKGPNRFGADPRIAVRGRT
jgi:uncharacterized membrane protein YhaH (DUF805 family)